MSDAAPPKGAPVAAWSTLADRRPAYALVAGVDLVVQLCRSGDGHRSITDIVRVRDVDGAARTSALGLGS